MFEKSKYFNKKETEAELIKEMELTQNVESLDDELYRLHLKQIQGQDLNELLEKDKSLYAIAKEQMEKDSTEQEMFDVVSKIRLNRWKIQQRS